MKSDNEKRASTDNWTCIDCGLQLRSRDALAMHTMENVRTGTCMPVQRSSQPRSGIQAESRSTSAGISVATLRPLFQSCLPLNVAHSKTSPVRLHCIDKAYLFDRPVKSYDVCDWIKALTPTLVQRNLDHLNTVTSRQFHKWNTEHQQSTNTPTLRQRHKPWSSSSKDGLGKDGFVSPANRQKVTTPDCKRTSTYCYPSASVESMNTSSTGESVAVAQSTQVSPNSHNISNHIFEKGSDRLGVDHRSTSTSSSLDNISPTRQLNVFDNHTRHSPQCTNGLSSRKEEEPVNALLKDLNCHTAKNLFVGREKENRTLNECRRADMENRTKTIVTRHRRHFHGFASRKYQSINQWRLSKLSRSVRSNHIGSKQCRQPSTSTGDEHTDSAIQSTSTDAQSFNRSSKSVPLARLPVTGSDSTYACPHCPIHFGQQALYTIHMGLHCVDQPWKCNMCGQVCVGLYEFTAHTSHWKVAKDAGN